MPNTIEFWKHVPSTAAAIFAVELPYRPPQSKIGTFIWRWRLWFETTVGLSVLEPWEKVLMIVFMYLLLTLTVTGLWKYLPEHVTAFKERMTYYLFGHEAEEQGAVQRLVLGWVGHNLSKEL